MQKLSIEKATIKHSKDYTPPPFLKQQLRYVLPNTSIYNMPFQTLAFFKATEHTHPATGSRLQCVTSILIWKFIQGLETTKQEHSLDLPVPWAKLLPLYWSKYLH